MISFEWPKLKNRPFAADIPMVGSLIEGRSQEAHGGQMMGLSRSAPKETSDETLLAALLERFPGAMVLAINESGVVVPVPEEVPLIDHHPLTSAFDSVVPSDRMAVVDLYARARAGGMASSAIHLVGDPSRTYTAYVVDCRARFGVLVAVLDDEPDAAGTFEQWALPRLPPRLARAHKDGAALYVSCDEALTEILGWPSDQLIGRRALELIHPDDQDLGIANWIDMMATPGPGRPVRLRHRHRDGRWVWLEVTNHNRLDDPGHGDVVADMVDISEEMAAQEALRAREQLLFELTQTVPLGLFHSTPDGSIIFANGRLFEIAGVTRLETIKDLLDAIDPGDRSRADAAATATLSGREDADLELRIQPGSGTRYGTLHLRAIIDNVGGLSGVIGCLEDVTDSVLMRQRLEVQATYDQLTDCRNRASTMAVLSSMLADLEGSQSAGVAVVYIDLDRFKPVNDAFGHATGDQLLMVVSERLHGAIRAGDVVGRIGGDEFIVICPRVVSPDDAQRVAGVIADRICGDANINGDEIPIRASVGVTWTNDPESNSDHMVATADAAMYYSKRDGLCQVVLADISQAGRSRDSIARPVDSGRTHS